MNEFFKNLKQEAQHLRLSKNEKQSMRVSLYEAMKQAPADVQEVRVSRAVRSTYVWFSPRFALPVAVVLVMGLGTGTAFAAQGALPGDMLYPVKINVNEAVEVALAGTPAQKATTEEHIAERRVAEAQTLAAQGRLDATTTQELEDNFDEHASRALAFTGEESAATTSVSIKAMSAQQRGGDERHAPRLGALRLASTTLEASSSEAQAPEGSLLNSEDTMSASLQTQKNIFNELKLRIDKRGHGGDNTNSIDTPDNNQNNNRGGDDQGN
jgi:hypothetical protein